MEYNTEQQDDNIKADVAQNTQSEQHDDTEKNISDDTERRLITNEPVTLLRDGNTSDVREYLHNRVKERLKDTAPVRKRVVGEKTRFQPKRNVKTRSEYRKDIVEGSSNFQQQMRKQITGTQLFQKHGRRNRRGYRLLKKKYNKASIALSEQLNNTGGIEQINNTGGYSSMLSNCVNVCFAQQVSAYKGIKEYGERAIAAMTKELIQLDEGAVKNKPVIEAIDYNTLTDGEKKKALDAVNIIELKRDGRLKGRSCANGSKQRSYLTEYESVASPTVSQEGIITTLLIGAYEGRKHISFDVPGAFLQADMPDDKLVLLKFKGRMADMLADVNEKYRSHVVRENGKSVLYVKVIRAIYGCIESALQWYKLFSETLVGLGFTLNDYDKCIANRMVKGKQMTISWHVDDCIVSHADQSVLDEFGKRMIEEFGEMEIMTGNKHDFLGMKIEINEDKTVSIDMRQQLQKVVEEFEQYDTVDANVVSPATCYLFNVNPNAEQLNTRLSEAFHSITSKLGYIMKRGRPDIETAVSFLMKRVSKSDTDDWTKLRRLIGFIKRTIDEIRVIGATSLTEIMTYVDSAYAVHENMRSHTGGLVSFGIGAAHTRSTTSKINVKSATESELVATAEYLPYTLWFRHFMKAQGYKLKDSVVYQDNKSAILMEVNGRNSCTGNSRHIDIRYFWIKDRVDNKEVRIEYLPTHIMLADYYTKPLQGSRFRVLREYIMGWRPMKDLIITKFDEDKSEN